MKLHHASQIHSISKIPSRYNLGKQRYTHKTNYRNINGQDRQLRQNREAEIAYDYEV